MSDGNKSKGDTVIARARAARDRFRRIFTIVTVMLLCASAASFLGPLWWLFENASEFTLQLAVAETLFIVPWVVLTLLHMPPRPSMLVPTGLLVLSWIGHLFLLAPLWIGPAPAAAIGEKTLKIMSANVLTSSDDFASLMSAVDREGPDVLILLEVDTKWRKALKPLSDAFPVREWSESEDNFGIAIFSRIRGTRTSVVNLAPDVPRSSETAHALVPWQDGVIEVIGVHLVPPVSQDYSTGNKAVTRAIAAHAASAKHPVVLAGDFNHTPFSSTFRRLRRNGGFSHARAGRGYLSSWPSGKPWMRIPIDHVLATGQIDIVSFRVLPAGGSDHNPVIAEIVMRDSKAPE